DAPFDAASPFKIGLMVVFILGLSFIGYVSIKVVGARRGIAPEGLAFEAGFGRTTLEYYDGFVFGALAPDRPDLPPIASGGRYDALTRALGQGRGIPAVGGIVRPEALLALAGGAP
ncbi:MAG: ATP phosphoribosyltransferase regulatory subunit, partial [Rhodobacteraceae bacterium]|nr:ATP phosphoribosyltransferase regulatory subunit [Paracoccaceae bacterium]